MKMLLVLFVFLFGSGPFATSETPESPEKPAIDRIAERYVHLVLALGQHDADYADAYYGPAEWKSAAEKEKKPLEAIGSEAAKLREEVEKIAPPNDEMEKLRRDYLAKQLTALSARVRMVKGERMKFDEESRALYDAVAPTLPDAHFQALLDKIEKRIPGEGPLSERYEKWRKAFILPNEKLDAVFQLAIKECRARTLAQVKLPPNETFTVEYVTNKPWGGYNWYKGNFRSVIQVNTDLPTYIDRAIDLAAHEGYPGHHVYNVLLEKNLVRDRGWVEFTVYPLYSPQSLIAEGTANFGKEVVFTEAERMAFELHVLWPAAGLDPARAEEYYAVQEMTKELSYAVNEAARRLINDEIDAKAAATWLGKYALMDPAQAQKRTKFIEHYRSYVINYNLGEDMVKRYVAQRVQAARKDASDETTDGHDADDPDEELRWRAFEQLLSSPRLPSGLN